MRTDALLLSSSIDWCQMDRMRDSVVHERMGRSGARKDGRQKGRRCHRHPARLKQVRGGDRRAIGRAARTPQRRSRSQVFFVWLAHRDYLRARRRSCLLSATVAAISSQSRPSYPRSTQVKLWAAFFYCHI